MIWRNAVYDILTTFKQVFDDREITPYHILFWACTVANKLAERDYRNNTTGLYLTIFDSVDVLPDVAHKNRKHITLPAQIFSLEGEGAVRFITYNYEKPSIHRHRKHAPNFTKITFQPTTVEKAERLYYDTYEYPAPNKPYFYRVGSKLYFLGIENVDVPSVEVGLFTVMDPATVVSLDDQIPLSDQLCQLMITEVRQMGAMALMIPKDRVNDGTDASETTSSARVPVSQVQQQQAEQSQQEQPQQ